MLHVLVLHTFSNLKINEAHISESRSCNDLLHLYSKVKLFPFVTAILS